MSEYFHRLYVFHCLTYTFIINIQAWDQFEASVKIQNLCIRVKNRIKFYVIQYLPKELEAW